MHAENNTEKNTFNEPIQHLDDAIRLLALAIECNAESNPSRSPKNSIHAECLAKKTLFGALSAKQLYTNEHTIILDEKEIRICDFSTINIIARACIESYLIFYYLFIDNCTEEEKIFRYNKWCACGMFLKTMTQNVPQEYSEKLRKNQEEAEKILTTIQASKQFQSLSIKQQNALISDLRKGKHKKLGWNILIDKAGLSKDIYFMYSYLCDHSHSGSIVSSEMRQPADIDEQRRHCHLAISSIYLFTGLFAWDYCNLFPHVKKFFPKTPSDLKTLEGFYTKSRQYNTTRPKQS